MKEATPKLLLNRLGVTLACLNAPLKRSTLAHGVLVAGLLVLPGCGSSDDEPTSPAGTTAATTATAAVPEAFVGSYTRTLTEADKRQAQAPLDEPPEGLPLGEMRLTIEPDGVAFAVHADRGDETIQMKVTSDRVEVTGGSYCTDEGASATYRWEATDDELTFTPIDVDCPDRQAVLAGTWTRE